MSRLSTDVTRLEFVLAWNRAARTLKPAQISDSSYYPLPADVENASRLAQQGGKASPSDTGLLSTVETFPPFSALLLTEQESCL